MSLPIRPDTLLKNVVVYLNGRILILGGQNVDGRNTGVIYAYCIENGVWRSIMPLASQTVPPATSLACAVVSENNDVYMFGGRIAQEGGTNSLWKLRIRNDNFIWKKITTASKSQSPSPRAEHSGWAYRGKLWIFAGIGPRAEGYLNMHGNWVESVDVPNNHCNNQLLCYDPREGWTNPECTGHVPSPRYCPGTAQIADKVWLFGGQSHGPVFDGLRVLDLTSLTWTSVCTSIPRGLVRVDFSFTALNSKLIALHGGDSADDSIDDPTYDTWLFDISTRQWSTYPGRQDTRRNMHIGVQGQNNTIYIIGGICAADEYEAVFRITLNARRLRVLALETVHQHRAILDLLSLPPEFQAELTEMNQTDREEENI